MSSINKAAHRLLNPLAVGVKYNNMRGAMFCRQHNWNIEAGVQIEWPEHKTPLYVARSMFGVHYPQSVAGEAADKLTTTWRLRSWLRFMTAEQLHIPYKNLGLHVNAELFLCHLPHVHPEDNTKIRYYKTEEHAVQDRHTITTIGRYLTEYYGHDYDANTIRDIASNFTAGTRRIGAQILRDPQEIVRAYIQGPHSCMAYDKTKFTEIHPTLVYGEGSDLSLAVVYDRNRNVTARGLVWESAKLYCRLYGDADALRHFLREQGYARGSFVGARIKKIKRSDLGDQHYAMPYIDGLNRNSDTEAGGGPLYVEEYDDHFVIAPASARGAIVANSQTGYIHVPKRINCACCNTRDTADQMLTAYLTVTDTSTTLICKTCASSNFARVRDGRTQNYVHIPRNSRVDMIVDLNERMIHTPTTDYEELTAPFYVHQFNSANTIQRFYSESRAIVMPNGDTIAAQHAKFIDDRPLPNGIILPAHNIDKFGVYARTLAILDDDNNEIQRLVVSQTDEPILLAAGAVRHRENFYTFTHRTRIEQTGEAA